MTPKTLTAMLVALCAAASMAAAQTDAPLDADGDGIVTLSEAQAALPGMTEEAFSERDMNVDGVLDEDEVAMAREFGTLPEENRTES